MRTLAIVQAHVANQGDGWHLTLDYLKRFLDTGRSAAEVPADVHAAFVALAGTLGLRTAELHNALAASAGHSAFDPEPMTADDIAADQRRVEDDLRQTFDALAASVGTLSGTTLELARAVIDARPRIEAALRGVSTDAGAMQKIRIHGDYHLGQVLVTKNDFVIIDFEGEPGRGFEARRARQSPLRDVAGMLRSFSYAQHSALKAAAAAGEDTSTVAPAMQDWERRVRTAFLADYAATVDARLWPEGIVGPRGLLRLYVLEKALYEMRYELGNRPEWLDIPLRGVLEAVAAD